MKDRPRELNENKLAGLIDMESEFKGDLTFKGSFRIEGTFKGTISSDSLLINGEIRGTLQATERIEVHDKGRVFGTLLAPTLVVEEGAYLEATCQTKGQPKPAAPGASEPAVA
jgi:cytoskeletal protein CcmA (bactofilin family)